MQLQKNQKSFIPRPTPENAQIVVSVLTPARPCFSTETRSINAFPSPKPHPFV